MGIVNCFYIYFSFWASAMASWWKEPMPFLRHPLIRINIHIIFRMVWPFPGVHKWTLCWGIYYPYIYVHARTCSFVCVCVYAHMDVCVRVLIWACVHVGVCVHVFFSVCMCLHESINQSLRKYARPRVCICICMSFGVGIRVRARVSV